MIQKKGFTLIELIIVTAIISILVTFGLGSYSSIQRRSRDTKRVADINELIDMIIAYEIEEGEYPGGNDDAGVHISPECPSDFRDDLVYNGYISEISSDPLSQNVGCTVTSTTANIDNAYFYGWDSSHAVMSECISVNRLETQQALDQLIEKHGQRLSVTSGGDANIGSGSNMQFNLCFVTN